MCKILEENTDVIRDYCNQNKLSFGRLCSLPRSFNNNFVAFQFHDPQKGSMGLRDETPAPVVLMVHKNGKGLEFEQTEYTRKYLSI